MNEFMEIMELMNYGLKQESTLKQTVPKIVKLGLTKKPNCIEKMLEFVLPEQAYDHPHKGLDEVVEACTITQKSKTI